MDVVNSGYMPGDPRLVQQLVYELKSQGIFDQFRKECISDVDTKPAYQNLRQRVEGSVTSFLKQQTWKSDMNKNHVREQLRKSIYESGYLEAGVERIVDQVVNPKINTVFLPQVEEVVYSYLGLAKPHREPKKELKLDVTDLLPTDLEAVSPESDHMSDSMDINEDIKESESNLEAPSNKDLKAEEDESPPFEPIEMEQQEAVMQQEENSVDSHLSGISGLHSHDSNPCNDTKMMDFSNQDSQVSQNSCESHLSIITSEENTKMEVCEDSESKLPTKPTDTDLKPDVPTSAETNGEQKDLLKGTEEIKSDKTDQSKKDEKKSDTKKYDEKKSEKNDDKKLDDKKHDDKKHDKRANEKDRDKKSRSSDKHSSRDRRDEKRDDKHRKSGSSKDRDKSNSKHNSSSSKDKIDKNKDKKDVKSSSSSSSSNKTKEKVDREKEKSDKEKSDKEKSDKEKSDKEKSDKEKTEKDRDKAQEKDKSKTSNSSSSKHSSSSSSKDKERSSSTKKEKESKDKEKSRSSSSKDKSKSSHSDSKSKSSSDKHRKSDKSNNDRPSSSSSSSKKDEKRDKDKKRESKKEPKDDHYSAKEKRNHRRSTDRDSNDGQSSRHNHSNSNVLPVNSAPPQKTNQDVITSSNSSGSGDSGTSDKSEQSSTKSPTKLTDKIENKEIILSPESTQKFKYIKPKFASNFEEARKLMKIRKQLAKLEKQNQLSLANIVVPVENGIVCDKNDVKGSPNTSLIPHKVSESKETKSKTKIEISDKMLQKEKVVELTSKSSPTEQIILETKEIVTEKKEIVSEKKEIVLEKKEIVSEKKEIVLKTKEIVSETKEIIPETKEIVSEAENLTKESTIPTKQVIPTQETVAEEPKTPERKECATPKVVTPLLPSTNLSKESWEALEARLAQEMSNVNYNSYETYDDYDCTFNSIVISPRKKIVMEICKAEEKIVQEEKVFEAKCEKVNNVKVPKTKETLERIENVPRAEKKCDIEDSVISEDIPVVEAEECKQEEKAKQDKEKPKQDKVETKQAEETCSLAIVDRVPNCIPDVLETRAKKKIQNLSPDKRITKNLQVILRNEPIKSTNEADEQCRYLEKPSPSSYKHLEFIHDYVLRLEKTIEDLKRPTQNNRTPAKRGRKRKLEDNVDLKNNNKAHYEQTVMDAKKRKRSIAPSLDSQSSMASNDRVCNSTDISPNNSFSLPLSPAESDKSIDKKEESPKSAKQKRNAIAKNTPSRSQRYSSDDLYKPRPTFSSTRRTRASKKLES